MDYILPIIPLFFLLFLLMFSMAIVMDKFVMTSLEYAVKMYKLSVQTESILLSIGSSIPEFSTNLMASLQGKNSIGIGAISGSGALCMTVPFALTGFMCEHDFVIGKFLYFRGVLFYLAALLLLTNFLSKGSLTLYEIILLILLWPLYILILNFLNFDPGEKDEKILAVESGENLTDRTKEASNNNGDSDECVEILDDESEKLNKSEEKNEVKTDVKIDVINSLSNNGAGGVRQNTYSLKRKLSVNNIIREKRQFSLDMMHDLDLFKNNSSSKSYKILLFFKQIFDKFYTFTSKIYSYFLPMSEKFPIFSFVFLLFIVFVHGIFVVDLITKISEELNTNEGILGSLIISWGDNLGDIINAIVLSKSSKEETADLLASSILFSQITGALLCLCVPWFVVLLRQKIVGKSENDDVLYVGVNDFYNLIICIILISVLLFLFNMKLQKKLSIFLIMVYIFYVVYEIIY